MFIIKALLSNYHNNEIIAHLTSLDENSNRLRFGVFMNNDSIKKYVNSIDFKKDRVYGAYDDALKLVGMVHIAWIKNDKKYAEIGISVDQSVRRGGIGGKLFKKAINYAKMYGAKRLYSFCLTENTAMMNMAKKENMIIEKIANEAEAYMVIDDNVPLDLYFQEYADEIISNTEFFNKYVTNNVVKPITEYLNNNLKDILEKVNKNAQFNR
jgi:RimJ/RimL family protein N-acetyltransferase